MERSDLAAADGAAVGQAGSGAASACCGDDPAADCCGETAATCCGTSAAQATVVRQAALPVAVIGAGPVGLAAVAHLIRRGETPIVFEAGASVGASVLRWGHVRLFSPWRYTVDAAAGALLEAAGWTAPDPEGYPTGRDLVEQYLVPLAALPQIRSRLRLETRVVSVSRKGFDKMKTIGREAAPFLLVARRADGSEERILAKAVIDASGTYLSPNPLGASGVPAPGETALAGRIFYGIPDVLGADRARYAGRRVLVVGSGHSAFNAILDLVALAGEEPATTILWAVRRASAGYLFGGGENDLLPARGELGQRVRRLVEGGRLRLVTGFGATELRASGDGVVVAGEEQALPAVDEIVATTGFRPDLSLLGELRLGLDPAVEAPVALAPLIDPNYHSCGTVRPHGVDELSHPDRGFYMAGMKSYGRAPTFLMLTGYEQVRSIAAAIAGDWEAARAVRLVLPETGVCSVAGSTAGAVICCGEGESSSRGPTGRHAPPVIPLAEVAAAPRQGCCG